MSKRLHAINNYQLTTSLSVIYVNSSCILYMAAEESHHHLFGKCSFSKVVWMRLLKWLQLLNVPSNSWQQLFTWMLIQSKGMSPKARIFKMIYTEYNYVIWKERKSRVFEDQARNVNSLLWKLHAYSTSEHKGEWGQRCNSFISKANQQYIDQRARW